MDFTLDMRPVQFLDQELAPMPDDEFQRLVQELYTCREQWEIVQNPTLKKVCAQNYIDAIVEIIAYYYSRNDTRTAAAIERELAMWNIYVAYHPEEGIYTWKKIR